MKNRLLILSLLVSVPAFAWQPQTGDIIFQISRSSQSKASNWQPIPITATPVCW